MIKYYLKDSDKEVKVGDRITISVPASTPYGQAKCDIDVLVTQESLNQLVNDNLVIKKEDNEVDFDLYKPFIRRIARKCGITFPEACELLDAIKSVSMNAHNAIMLEAMAEVFNRGMSAGPKAQVYVINAHNHIACTMREGLNCPFFITQENAIKALELLKPFLNEF